MRFLGKSPGAAIGLVTVIFCGGCSSQTGSELPEKRSSLGPRDSSQLPDWVPIYPGTKPSSISSKHAGIEHYFNFQLVAHDPCAKIVDWYEQKLIAAGYKTYGRFDYGDGRRSTVRSDGPDRTRSINVSASTRVDDVIIGIESVERGNASKGANVGIPAWIPMYPGINVVHVEASSEPSGTQHKFSFTSKSEAAAVYPWYESQLAGLGFKCTFSAPPNSAGSFTGTAANGRRFTIHSFPTPPDFTFVAEASDR